MKRDRRGKRRNVIVCYLADNVIDVAVVTWDVHVELEFLLHVGGRSP